MARQKTMVAGAINIKIHPHSPKKYVELLSLAFELKESRKIRGTEYGTIGWLKILEPGKPLAGLVGEFYRFININPNDPWFDERKREVIEIDGEIVKSPPVPEHLKPNLRRILFIFYPERHRLFFDAKNFSHASAQKLVNGLLSSVEIFAEFGQVDVHVESSEEAIERILRIPRKERLEIHITLPNPDDSSSEEQRVLDRLNRVGARRLSEIYRSGRGGNLTPDQDIKTFMRVAKSNGRVYAVGYDEHNKRIEESTDPHPLTMREEYNPQLTSESQSLDRVATKLWSQISNR